MKADDEVDNGRRQDDLGQDSGKERRHLAEVEGQRAEEPGGDLSATERDVFGELVDEAVENREGVFADENEKDALKETSAFSWLE